MKGGCDMQKDLIMDYAGDLSMELEEIEKLIPDEDKWKVHIHRLRCVQLC